MQKLIFCNNFFCYFFILQDINKMIISHITTKYSDTVFVRGVLDQNTIIVL